MKAQQILSGHWFLRRADRILELPTFAAVELTTRCNCSCANCRALIPEADTGPEGGRDMSSAKFELLQNKLPFMARLKFAGFGEPFKNLISSISLQNRPIEAE